MVSENELFFNSLFEKTHGKAFNFVKKLSNNEQIAADVTQAAFIKIWLDLDTYMKHPDVEALVYVTVKHLFLDEMRKINRLNAMFCSVNDKDEMDRYFAVATVCEKNYLKNELVEIITHCLNKLPQKIKEAYEAYLFKDIAINEIAKNMQLSVSTVSSYVKIAKRVLQKELKQF